MHVCLHVSVGLSSSLFHAVKICRSEGGCPQAQLNKAAHGTSKLLDLRPSDLLLYSAKQIPGNEKRVIRLINKIANRGTEARPRC